MTVMFLLLQILILSEKLHSVTSQFDQLRAVRFQEAINRAMPRRKPKRAPEKTSTDISYSSNSRESREPTSSETRDHGEILAEPMKVQKQLLDDETRALQVFYHHYCGFYLDVIRGDKFNPLC